MAELGYEEGKNFSFEVESGKSHCSRLGLARALEACRRYGAKLIISRLDRLSRDPVFLLSLRDAGIDFTAVDMPNANRMTVGVMALVAEQEREAISKRTTDALAAAKARGVKLGNPRPETARFRDRVAAAVAGTKGAATARQSADKFAELVRPLIEDDRRVGSAWRELTPQDWGTAAHLKSYGEEAAGRRKRLGGRGAEERVDQPHAQLRLSVFFP
jgi:DNA invertase Pin-like site-specific DNA recombinase